MKRKDFFKNVLLGTTGLLLTKGTAAQKTAGKQKIMLGTVFISGFQYYDGPETENLQEKGIPLQLNRQPHNRYDKYAMEIFTGGAKLGYVPRAENKTISELMEQGIEVKAEIKELYPDARPLGNVKQRFYIL